VTWERYTARGFESPTRVWCSAWTYRERVHQVDTEDYSRVPRVRLDGDQRWWPAPPEPRLSHYGVLEAGTALDAAAVIYPLVDTAVRCQLSDSYACR
jgi:hypothetical protein